MNNVLFGTLTVTICAIGYYYSLRFYKAGNEAKAISLIILCGLALRLFVSCDFYLHAWDERYHALVAKNLLHHLLMPTLYEHPILPYDFRSWIGNHIWLHKQPLALWGIAGSFRLFGCNEIALRMPSFLLTTIGIWLTYYIGKSLIGKEVGLLSAFLYSINGFIIELSGGLVPTDHVDVFFLFFIQLSVALIVAFAFHRKPIFNVLAGAAMGAAILSKWLPALVVVPLWYFIAGQKYIQEPRKFFLYFIIFIGASIAVFLPWQVYIFHVFPNEARWEMLYNFQHVTNVLEHQETSWHFYLDKLRINYGELIYLPIGWFIWRTAKKPAEPYRLAICVWAVIPILIFSFVKTKMPGYILISAPAFFLITADFWFMLYRKRSSVRWPAFVSIFLVILAAIPIRYAIERMKPFEVANRNPQWVMDLKDLKNKGIDKGILFNYSKPIEAMFYTNLTAYAVLPDSTELTALLKNGYTIIINYQGHIPDNLKSMKGMRFVTLAQN